MLIAAPLASYIPLAALAAVLVVVAWNMAEKHEFATLIRSSRGDAVVLLATFLLTIFRDLTEGILVGFALGAVLFINRMAEMTGIEAGTPLVIADRADDGNGERVPYDPGACRRPRRAGLSHHRRLLLRRGIGGRQRARRHRRQAQGLRGRFRRGAVPGFDRGERDGRVSPPRRGARASGSSSPAPRPRCAARCSPMASARRARDIAKPSRGPSPTSRTRRRRGWPRPRTISARELAHDSEKCSRKITQKKQVIAVLEMHSHKHSMTLRTGRTQSRL